jgi:hypothetical protein
MKRNIEMKFRRFGQRSKKMATILREVRAVNVPALMKSEVIKKNENYKIPSSFAN